jgi:hypothetical protein
MNIALLANLHLPNQELEVAEITQALRAARHNVWTTDRPTNISMLPTPRNRVWDVIVACVHTDADKKNAWSAGESLKSPHRYSIGSKTPDGFVEAQSIEQVLDALSETA